MTPAEIRDRLRSHAAAEKAARRPPMPPEPIPEAVEPSLADLCKYCGTDPSTTIPCGEECAGCGEPVKAYGGPVGDETYWHVHGGGCDDPRPVREQVTL